MSITWAIMHVKHSSTAGLYGANYSRELYNVNKTDTIEWKRMGFPKGSVLSFVHFAQSIINLPHYDGQVKKTPTMSKWTWLFKSTFDNFCSSLKKFKKFKSTNKEPLERTSALTNYSSIGNQRMLKPSFSNLVYFRSKETSYDPN